MGAIADFFKFANGFKKVRYKPHLPAGQEVMERMSLLGLLTLGDVLAKRVKCMNLGRGRLEQSVLDGLLAAKLMDTPLMSKIWELGLVGGAIGEEKARAGALKPYLFEDPAMIDGFDRAVQTEVADLPEDTRRQLCDAIQASRAP
jgi:hypothetical protein